MSEKKDKLFGMLENVSRLLDQLEIKGQQNIMIMYGIMTVMQGIVKEINQEEEDIPKKE